MLRSVFWKSKQLLAPDAVIYVRTDTRNFTFESTVQALLEAFPEKKMRYERHSIPAFIQTSLFDAEAKSQGEVDLVLW